MGIRNLKNQSKALRIKWLWKYSKEPQSLWGKVIKAKYGEENNWVSKKVRTSYGVSVWKSIRELWPIMKNHSSIRVNNGRNTSFWNDNWLGIGSLKERYPDMFGLAQNQHKTVADMRSCQGWEIALRRQLNDWEITRLTDLYKELEAFTGLQEGLDSIWWKRHNRGVYRVKDAYKILNHDNQQVDTWPWKHIWKTKIPYKVACFTWLLAKEAVLTQDNLIKRGISLCSRCFLCGENAETVNHLFLHCKITDQLWKIFISLRGISWSMPYRIKDVIYSWEEAGAEATSRDRWRTVPACIWWTVWRERNARCFEDRSNPVQKIKLNCILLFCFWCKQMYTEDTLTIIDILGSC